MRFLFLSDRIAFHPSATQICARNLGRELVSQGHSVTVVSMGERDGLHMEPDGLAVVTIGSSVYQSMFCDLGGGSGLTLLARRAHRRMLTARAKATGWSYTDVYAQAVTVPKVSKFVNIDAIDVLVSFSEPFSTHIVGRRMKEALGPAAKWVAYEMDPFALNYNRSRGEEARNRVLEEDTLESADLIVLADGIAEENHKRDHLVRMEGKSISLPVPALDSGCRMSFDHSELCNGPAVEDRAVRLIYTGMFYPAFRTPDALIDILAAVDFDFEFHIYGDDDGRAYPAFEKVRDKCVFHGRKTREECVKACADADILIDIQNDIPNQVPSKLLSYMSLNKPIVSFYSLGCAIGIRYLEHYTNALCILKENARDRVTIDAFKNFCLAGHIPMSQDELHACLAPFTVKSIVDELLRALAGA